VTEYDIRSGDIKGSRNRLQLKRSAGELGSVFSDESHALFDL
jgi:hypothetical protein